MNNRDIREKIVRIGLKLYVKEKFAHFFKLQEKLRNEKYDIETRAGQCYLEGYLMGIVNGIEGGRYYSMKKGS